MASVLKTVELPTPIWTRAVDRARAEGLPTFSEAVVALVDGYRTGKLRVTAWPVHEFAAIATERIQAALDPLADGDVGPLSATEIRQLLAGLDLDQLAAQLEISPAHGLLTRVKRSYRCPEHIWSAAEDRRAADGFADMTKLVVALITRYALGAMTLR